MRSAKLFIAVFLACGAFGLVALVGQARAGSGFGLSTDEFGADRVVPTFYANSPAGIWTDWNGVTHDSGTALEKFVDELPPVGCGSGGVATVNDIGQCLPIGEPNAAYQVGGQDPYPGSDYYEIAIVEYREQMHRDLPALVDGVAGGAVPTGGTKIRGYVQIVPQGYVSPVTGLTAVPLDKAHGCTEDVMIPDANGTLVQAYGATRPHYLGPVIITQKGTPVRIKYSNLLPIGASGDLFIPVDHTLMGAGKGYLQGTADPDADTYYTENRIAVHEHGGDTPWVSDGTPNQWTVPVGETTPYPTGASLANVPDMPTPGQGQGTLYYTNDISGRLMFYHDHAVGITRLNVYAGMAAGYEIQDPSERSLTDPSTGTIPVAAGHEIPLVIQEKTFVPKDIGLAGAANLAACTDPANYGTYDSQDCKWDTTHWGGYGDLWYVNVYEFNQDLDSYDGTNPVGRWDYGPYFWPIFPVSEVNNAYMTDPVLGTYGHESTTPEAFGDTPIVNGTAYPTLTVAPAAYRFRILNASNDKFFNLGLYRATRAATCSVSGGTGYVVGDVINPTGGLDATVPNAQAARVRVTAVDGSGAITGYQQTRFGAYQSVPGGFSSTTTTGSGAAVNCTLSGLTEMAMVPFDSSGTFPSTGGLIGSGWGTPDQREGGIPSPATVGPDIIAIGSEGGILPAPVIIPSTPVNYEYNKRSVTVLNVFEHGLLLGPAERSDIIVDFSQFAGQTLILYNDCPAPIPAGDPRLDYYTGDPDFTDSGGAPTTLPGYGPNTRTVMQIKVTGTSNGTAINTANLASDLAAAYAATQPAPVVWEPNYAAAFPTPQDVDSTSTAGPWPTAYKYATIRTGSLVTPTFNFIAGSTISYYPYEPFTLPLGSTLPVLSTTRTTVKAGELAQMPVQSKAIQELFDPWGRMNATLGAELPFTNSNNQTTVPLGYTDPAIVNADTGAIEAATLEMIEDGETQIWKITHNGVDTHPVHFHLVNVQLIDRVGWDGTFKLPDANEQGWKETVKMNPLEDVIVAVRANAPKLPFGLPESVRPISPSEPIGSTNGFTNFDPLTGNAFAYGPAENRITWFGWEYVWHCHILGHEENDFMRPFIFKYPAEVPDAPTNVVVTANGGQLDLSWTDPTPIDYATDLAHSGYGSYQNEIGFRIERSVNGGPYATIGTALANATTFTDSTVDLASAYRYRVIAYNAAGESSSTIVGYNLNSGTVLVPNGGETVVSGDVLNIQWLAVPTATRYNIWYSPDNTTTWKWIGQTGNVTSYDWVAPAVAVSNSNVLVRVVGFDGGGAKVSSDRSDAPFTVAPRTAVTLVAPNGGENLISGNVYAVQWKTPTVSPVGYYAVRYSVDNGATWTHITAIGGKQTSYNWTVPAVATEQTNSLFRISAFAGNGTLLSTATSAAPFTISPPASPVTVSIVAPNGGETLTSGNVLDIHWTAPATAVGYFSLVYSLDNGGTWNWIGTAGGKKTSYSWTVPTVAAPTSTSLLRVNVFDAAGVQISSDTSNATFTIQP